MVLLRLLLLFLGMVRYERIEGDVNAEEEAEIRSLIPGETLGVQAMQVVMLEPLTAQQAATLPLYGGAAVPLVSGTVNGLVQGGDRSAAAARGVFQRTVDGVRLEL